MGLDNEIYIRTKDKINFMPFADDYARSWRDGMWDDTLKSYEYNVAYWRKCYNVRDILYKAMSHTEHELVAGDPNNGVFKVPFEALSIVIAEYKKILNKEEWDKGDSIWEWDDYYEVAYDQYSKLIWLHGFLTSQPDNSEIEIYFVDSW